MTWFSDAEKLHPMEKTMKMMKPAVKALFPPTMSPMVKRVMAVMEVSIRERKRPEQRLLFRRPKSAVLLFAF
jgi:hypothetical protein